MELGHLDWVEPCRVRPGGPVTLGRAKVWQAVADSTRHDTVYDLGPLDKGATKAMLTRRFERHGHATPDETDRALTAHWTAVNDDLGARTGAPTRKTPWA